MGKGIASFSDDKRKGVAAFSDEAFAAHLFSKIKSNIVKYSEDQERDDAGRFSSDGSGGGSGGSATAGSTGRVAGKDIASKVNSDDVMKWYGESKGFDQADAVIGNIAKMQGFDGPATVVSPEEFDRLAAERSDDVMYRGMAIRENGEYLPVDQVTERFVSGEYFAGHGVFGNGIYTSSEKSTAEKYAHGFSQPLEMMLTSDAKVASLEEYTQIDRANTGATNVFDLSGRPDTGWVLAAKGYDAYHAYTKDGEKIVVVLNRTALIVKGN
jgi:hypothetical protein